MKTDQVDIEFQQNQKANISQDNINEVSSSSDTSNANSDKSDKLDEASDVELDYEDR